MFDSQGAWRRGWDDTWRLTESRIVRSVGLLAGVAVSYFAYARQWNEALLSASVAILCFLLALAANLIAAPIRQRNEAWRELEKLQAESLVDPVATLAQRLREMSFVVQGDEMTLAAIFVSWQTPLLRGANPSELIMARGKQVASEQPLNQLLALEIVESNPVTLPPSPQREGFYGVLSLSPETHYIYQATTLGKAVLARLLEKR